MVAFRITGMSGVVPRRGNRLLDPNQAQVAVNCRITSGYLVPLKQPRLVTTPGVTGIKSIFKASDGVNDSWLAWNRDVDAAKGPIAGDTSFRTYYTGDGEPRVTNLGLATAGSPFPFSFFVLGVFPPQTAASLAAAGGVSGTTVNRAFCYTFVTPFGEESQPSPATTVVNGKIDDTWTIGGTIPMDVAPLNSMSVTNASWSAGIATLTVASVFGLRIGEETNVTGMNPAGYNGTKLAITALTSTTVSYALVSNPGAFVSGGTLSRVAPHNTAGMTKNIYWTETLATGTVFRLVKNVSVVTTSTTIANATTISTADLVSATWVMPPTDLKGMQFMPNGIAIAFHGNEICFSPPFIPYAFPIGFRETVDYNVVGIGVTGTMAVIGTQGNPYTFSGIDPSAMSQSKLDHPWPCSAKRSMVNVEGGVAYSTPVGLALVGPGVQQLITRQLYTKEEWTLLNPSGFYAAHYAGRYVTAFDFSQGQRQVLIIDQGEGGTDMTSNANVTAFYGDQTTGKLYAVINDSIYEWDADPGNTMIYDWMSGEKLFDKPVNLGAAKVDADFTMTADQIAAAQAANAAALAINAAIIAAKTSKGSLNSHSLNARSLNGSLVQAPPPLTWNSLTFQLYVSGALKFSKTLTNSNSFRLPDGYKSDNCALRVQANITVKALLAAETMTGLAQA